MPARMSAVSPSPTLRQTSTNLAQQVDFAAPRRCGPAAPDGRPANPTCRCDAPFSSSSPRTHPLRRRLPSRSASRLWLDSSRVQGQSWSHIPALPPPTPIFSSHRSVSGEVDDALRRDLEALHPRCAAVHDGCAAATMQIRDIKGSLRFSISPVHVHSTSKAILARRVAGGKAMPRHHLDLGGAEHRKPMVAVSL